MSIDLSAVPRVTLGHLPTPLEPLDRFSSAIGASCRIWIKRDDCTGLATGGNKTRKLEFLLADARAQDADVVITFGALQSNHARQTAAACARLGLECHLILSSVVKRPDADYQTNGNLLLDRILGAAAHRVSPADVTNTYRQLMDRLKTSDKRAYVIPAGGSNAIGAIGYVGCANEIAEQSSALGFTPDAVVHASSSGGTQAGLALGFGGSPTQVLGINVSDAPIEEMRSKITALANETAITLGAASPLNIDVRDGFVGDGYGQTTAGALAAIRLLATTEGIVTDPVYTGKALAGLISMARNGGFGGGRNVVFVHTGGVAAIAAYATAF